jgi:DNA-binding transcriptional ArsR family regulator
MNEQLDLLTRPVARATDPGTSWSAARDAEPNAGTNRELALRLLREHPGGLTDFELAERTGLQQTSIGKRRGELRDAGLVRDSGERRRAPSGSLAIVWQAVPIDLPRSP